ncbi:9678_t:CDS:2, partial [Funneliformis geosporum]
ISSLANSSPKTSIAVKINASHKQQTYKQQIIHKSDVSVINNNLNISQQFAAHRYVDNNFANSSPSSISQKEKDCVLPSTDLKDNTNLLTLILSKLQELDSIKEHLAKLDSQMLSFANLNGPLAQRL